MRVGRLNFNTKKMEIIKEPFKVDCDEQLIITIDQSSRGTGLTVGSSKTGPKEILLFSRQSTEQTGEYLRSMEQWLMEFFKGIRILEFAPEMWFTSGYHESDKVMKQVFGVMEHLYNKGMCLDIDGNLVPIKKVQPVFNPIANQTWKSAIVPIEYFRFYDEDSDAYVAFATKIFEPLLTAGADCCASFLMYLYLVKSKYGTMRLRPSRANIEPNHSLVLTAIPLEVMNGNHPLRHELRNGTLTDKSIRSAYDLDKHYNEGYIRRYFSIMKNFPYSDVYIDPVKDEVDKALGLYLKSLPSEELKGKINLYSGLKLDINNIPLREIEMVDNMTIEEMFRSFTGLSKDIYYMVVEPSLHYNYLISQYRIQMLKRQKIIVIGYKYA